MDAIRQEIRRCLRGARLPRTAAPAAPSSRPPLPRTPRAVLFDVYGTLLLDAARPARGPLSAAARARSLLRRHRVELPREGLAARIAEAVAGEHASLRGRGIRHPEVRIERLWSSILPGRGDDALDRGPERHGLQPLRRHAVLREQLPLQGAPLQLVQLRPRR